MWHLRDKIRLKNLKNAIKTKWSFSERNMIRNRADTQWKQRLNARAYIKRKGGLTELHV